MSIAVSAPHGCITLPHANCCMLPISKVSRMSCATCSPDACSWHYNVSFDSRFLLAEYFRVWELPFRSIKSTMLCTMKLSRSLIGRGKLADCCEYFGIANEDAHSALSDAHATAILLGRLLEADPKWPGFQRRLDAAGAAAEQWPTFATLPKKEWLPRGTHLA